MTTRHGRQTTDLEGSANLHYSLFESIKSNGIVEAHAELRHA